MTKKTIGALGVAIALVLGFVAGRVDLHGAAAADAGKLSALDYDEITQLINRYAYGIDTCGGNGYDYANVFTTDGQFIDKNSDAGFAAGGRVLAKGRDALAELVGGGSKGCKTTLPWTGWSHLMLNHEITATPEGAKGRIYLVQLGIARDVVREHLDRDDAVEARIARLVDLAHAADADDGENLVRPESFPGGERHRPACPLRRLRRETTRAILSIGR